MDLKKLFQDDDAVSPVIGVILMVAITVILAAVIASFVLNLGGNTSAAPTVSFDFEYSEDSTLDASDNDDFMNTSTGGNLDITHNSGDSIRASRITILDEEDASKSGGDLFSDTQISSGNSAEIEVDSDDTIRIVYTDDSGEDSTTLATWDGPDA